MTTTITLFGSEYSTALTLTGETLVLVRTGPSMWWVAGKEMTRRVLGGLRLEVVRNG